MLPSGSHCLDSVFSALATDESFFLCCPPAIVNTPGAYIVLNAIGFESKRPAPDNLATNLHESGMGSINDK